MSGQEVAVGAGAVAWVLTMVVWALLPAPRRHPPLFPRDAVHGREALAAREEILRVRLEHRRLCEAWLAADESERDRIQALILEQEAKLDDIGRRYFGEGWRQK